MNELYNNLYSNLYKYFTTTKEIICFVVETTGFSSEKDDIIQISAIKIYIENGKPSKIKGILNEYIKTNKKIPKKVSDINGITNQILENKPTEKEIFEKIFNFFGSSPETIIGYNVNFDIEFLKSMFLRNNKTFIPITTLDVLQMAKELINKDKISNYKLETICKLMNYKIDFHNSLEDAKATSYLFNIFIDQYIKKLKNKNTVEVTDVKYWKGYDGFGRLYVTTNIGKVFFSIKKKKWEESEKFGNVLSKISSSDLTEKVKEWNRINKKVSIG